MQFLRLFFTALLAVVGAGLVLFFGGREVFVFLARASLSGEVSGLRTLKAFPKNYFSQCAEMYSRLGSQSSLAGFQIHFLDAKNYQVEAVCSYDTTQPIVIKSKTLPFYVSKLPGSSGIFLGMETFAPSSFDIDIFGRKTTIKLSPVEGELVNEVPVFPVSMCEGWGYQCCVEDSEVSSGHVVEDGAIDCPGSCAPICQKRPVIFSFNAAPSFNATSRTATITSGTTVELAYVFGDSDGKVTSATVDFGDGSRSEVPVTTNSGIVKHTYVCNTSQCLYTAKLTLIDNDNLSSNANNISTIRINMSGR